MTRLKRAKLGVLSIMTAMSATCIAYLNDVMPQKNAQATIVVLSPLMIFALNRLRLAIKARDLEPKPWPWPFTP